MKLAFSFLLLVFGAFSMEDKLLQKDLGKINDKRAQQDNRIDNDSAEKREENRIINDELPCIICYEEITGKEEHTETDCGHIYHSDCINKWMKRGKYPECPLCREPLAVANLTITVNGKVTKRLAQGENILISEDSEGNIKLFDPEGKLTRYALPLKTAIEENNWNQIFLETCGRKTNEIKTISFPDYSTKMVFKNALCKAASHKVDVNAKFCVNPTSGEFEISSTQWYASEYSETPLTIITERGNAMDQKTIFDSISILANRGADPNVKTRSESSPLCDLVESFLFLSVKSAKLLLQKGADPNVQCRFGNSALHKAVEWRNLKMVKLLLMFNATIDKNTREMCEEWSKQNVSSQDERDISAEIMNMKITEKNECFII